jgi:hypothetical protein
LVEGLGGGGGLSNTERERERERERQLAPVDHRDDVGKLRVVGRGEKKAAREVPVLRRMSRDTLL